MLLCLSWHRNAEKRSNFIQNLIQQVIIDVIMKIYAFRGKQFTWSGPTRDAPNRGDLIIYSHSTVKQFHVNLLEPFGIITIVCHKLESKNMFQRFY